MLNREAVNIMKSVEVSIKGTMLYTIIIAYMYMDFEKSSIHITDQFLWQRQWSLSVENSILTS